MGWGERKHIIFFFFWYRRRATDYDGQPMSPVVGLMVAEGEPLKLHSLAVTARVPQLLASTT